MTFGISLPAASARIRSEKGRGTRGGTHRSAEGSAVATGEPDGMLVGRRQGSAAQARDPPAACTILLAEGDRSTHLFLLVDGCVKVTAGNEDGHVALLAIRVGGDLVGELSCLDGHPRAATVTAAGHLVARTISQPQFHLFLRDHPFAALAVSASVGDKLRSATRRWVDFNGREAR